MDGWLYGERHALRSSRSECKFLVKKPFFGMAALALTGKKYCVI